MKKKTFWTKRTNNVHDNISWEFWLVIVLFYFRFYIITTMNSLMLLILGENREENDNNYNLEITAKKTCGILL